MPVASSGVASDDDDGCRASNDAATPKRTSHGVRFVEGDGDEGGIPAPATHAVMGEKGFTGRHRSSARRRRLGDGGNEPQADALSLWLALALLVSRVVALLRTAHRALVFVVVDVAIASGEETAKSTCREVIRQTLRFSNAIAASFLSFVDDKTIWRRMRRQFSKAHGHQAAWSQFWSLGSGGGAAYGSSFNALFDGPSASRSADRRSNPAAGKPSTEAAAAAETVLPPTPPLSSSRSSASDLQGSTRGPEERDAAASVAAGWGVPGVSILRGMQWSWPVRRVRRLGGLVWRAVTMPDAPSGPGSGEGPGFNAASFLHEMDVDVSGFLEDLSVSAQIAIAKTFDAVKVACRVALLDPSLIFARGGLASRPESKGRRAPISDSNQEARADSDAHAPARGPRLRRSPSVLVLQEASRRGRRTPRLSIADTVTEAGYPHVKMTVTTGELFFLRRPIPSQASVPSFSLPPSFSIST